MSAWGGFKRKVHGVLGGWMVCSFFFALMGLGTGVPFWIATNALSALFVPLINGSNQAIWQIKVAPDVQGRVFSARTLIAWLTNPISPLIAGTLADFVLEPAMRAPSTFSTAFGWLVPPGPGAGTGLLIFFSCLGGILAGLAGYLIHTIREAEDILPDHDQMVPAEAA
jgi:uncharacterized iron-regulated membrane protein